MHFLNEKINKSTKVAPTNGDKNLRNKSIAENYERGISEFFGSNQIKPSSIMRMKEYKLFKSFISELSTQSKRDGLILQNETPRNSRISYDLCSLNNPDHCVGAFKVSKNDIASKHIRFYDGETGVSIYWYPLDQEYNKVFVLATYELDETKEYQNELDCHSSRDGIFFNSNLEEFTKGTSLDELSLCELFSDNFELWRDNVECLLTEEEQELIPRIARFMEIKLDIIDNIYSSVANYTRKLRMQIGYKIDDFKVSFKEKANGN